MDMVHRIPVILSGNRAEEPVHGTYTRTVRAHGTAAAEAIRLRAHDRQADEPVVEERRPGLRIRASVAGAEDPDRGHGALQYLHQGLSRWHRHTKNFNCRINYIIPQA